MASKYYFTYGSDDGGGWTEVTADNEDMAREVFCMYHPRREGFIPCCGIYPAEEFEKTSMHRNGNLGKRCVEHIILNHFAFMEARHGAGA